jgi:hypothetical protein
MAGAKMASEQGMVQLGLAQKASGISQRLPFVGSFASRKVGMSANGFPSEVYVIGKPLCPV